MEKHDKYMAVEAEQAIFSPPMIPGSVWKVLHSANRANRFTV